MKRIINNRRYDTEKAKEIGRGSGGFPGDFNYYEEVLYKKRTGEYFIYGRGNANTKYAVQVDSGTWSGGSAITPLSYGEAREWAEKHLDADEYEAEFEVIEDDKIVTSISLRPSTFQKLKAMSSEQNKPVGEIIDALIK